MNLVNHVVPVQIVLSSLLSWQSDVPSQSLSCEMQSLFAHKNAWEGQLAPEFVKVVAWEIIVFQFNMMLFYKNITFVRKNWKLPLHPFSSSLLSKQSFFPSHTFVFWMHLLLLHRKLFKGHVPNINDEIIKTTFWLHCFSNGLQ